MLILGYWDIRGVAQPLRYLLTYLLIEFVDKTYTGEGQDWFNKDKLQLGIPLPNLPYLIDGDIKISQSNAILVHLVKKYNRPDLIGANADGSYSEKEIQFYQVLGTITDIRNKLYHGIFSDKFDDVKEQIFKKSISPPFYRLVEYLGEKEYLVGTLTYADFAFYDLTLYLKNYYPDLVVPTEYLQRIENIPEIKQYFVSPTFINQFKNTDL